MRLFKTLKTALYITLGVLAINHVLGCKPRDDDPPIVVPGPVAMATASPDRSAYANDLSSLVAVDATASSSGVPLTSFTFSAYDSSSNLIDSYTETTTSFPDGVFDGFTERNYPFGTYSIDVTVEDEWSRTDMVTKTGIKRGPGVIDGTGGETGDRTGLQDYLEDKLINDFGYTSFDDLGGAGGTTTPSGETIYSVAYADDADAQRFLYTPNLDNLTTAQKTAMNDWNDGVLDGVSASLYFCVGVGETPAEIEQRVTDFYNATTKAEKLAILMPTG